MDTTNKELQFKELQLKDREWTYPDCRKKHDRYINSTINIKKFALIDQNLIGL
ncbi:Mobile element protein [Methanosarcina barkeri str. Wiesmoor]|uniref:Mobile element protein n=1 Tax=Methanosarcina barkeri str. Wiesmoor TaxID=1434109 RepID=A0A0E3QNN0_METBA|nr:Mobile element protein [Methanosarcina barkeri str. Wiesmoor]